MQEHPSLKGKIGQVRLNRLERAQASPLVDEPRVVEEDVTHAIDQVPILAHWIGRRIFVNDCPLEFFESQRLKILNRFAAVAGIILPLLENEIQAVSNHP